MARDVLPLSMHVSITLCCMYRLLCALVWLTLCARSLKRSLEKLKFYLFLISPAKYALLFDQTSRELERDCIPQKRECNLAFGWVSCQALQFHI